MEHEFFVITNDLAMLKAMEVVSCDSALVESAGGMHSKDDELIGQTQINGDRPNLILG